MVTGSVPTENLPEKSHEAPKRERRPLVRNVNTPDIDQPSTSYQPALQYCDFEDFTNQLEEKNIQPWQFEISNEGEIRIHLHDQLHSVPKYIIVVNSSLEFTIFVFNWPLPDQHPIYKEQKRSLKYLDIAGLIEKIENARVCEGLKEDDAIAVATDPTGNPDPNPNTIVRHTVPKTIEVEEPHFEVTVSHRSVACEVLVNTESDKNLCKPCASACNTVKRAARKKSKAAATPAKPKASLTACEPEKLRATVKSTRLQVKDLEDRLQEFQCKIKEQGIGISESLEKDILKIMGGQTLEATPHMKFFCQEQMKLLQSAKMGRRYHPQVIRFALSLHGKSPSAYREL